jgi:hypothetical protein
VEGTIPNGIENRKINALSQGFVQKREVSDCKTEKRKWEVEKNEKINISDKK